MQKLIRRSFMLGTTLFATALVCASMFVAAEQSAVLPRPSNVASTSNQHAGKIAPYIAPGSVAVVRWSPSSVRIAVRNLPIS